VSKFQHHIMLCSSCSTSLVSSSNLRPTCWWKVSCPCFMLLLPWKSCISFDVYILHHLLSCYPNSWYMLHSPVVSDLSHSVMGMVHFRLSLH
jgi:hypothetical protein